MRSFSRFSSGRLPRAASHHDPATVSPAALRIAQEADATMSPDGWEADYSAPALIAETPAASPVFSLAGALPTA